jgi:hypothetical protein
MATNTRAAGTYTVAFDKGGVLLAVVPDGQDIAVAVQAEAENANLEVNLDDVSVETGLVLTNDPDLIGAGDVIYSGTEFGWLNDENGAAYEHAVRLRC